MCLVGVAVDGRKVHCHDYNKHVHVHVRTCVHVALIDTLKFLVNLRKS